MSINISEIKKENKGQWDSYVKSHLMGNIYQLSGWKDVIQNAYGHKTYYLMATHKNTNDPSTKSQYSNRIVGILPLIHIKHILFGNSLISIPFCDMGGILADNEEIERKLLHEAIEMGKRLDTSNIEIRNLNTLKSMVSINKKIDGKENAFLAKRWHTQATPNKVRMILELPETSDELMNSFKSKLRSQIRKPIKEGVETRIGQTEILDDFYHVFAINMKDLGSPVHSKRLFQNILKEFSGNSEVVVAYCGKKPAAGGILLNFKETMMNPWASFIKSYKKMSPNMLLYWSMLAHACDNGFKYFDFGRCTPGGGTYKFKEQWGATPESLDYSYFSNNGSFDGMPISEKKLFKIGSEVWKKLPVLSTKILGPKFRKYIGL